MCGQEVDDEEEESDDEEEDEEHDDVVEVAEKEKKQLNISNAQFIEACHVLNVKEIEICSIACFAQPYFLYRLKFSQLMIKYLNFLIRLFLKENLRFIQQMKSHVKQLILFSIK
eukprot:403330697